MTLLIFLITSLVDCRSLCNAVIVAPPDYVGALWELQNPLDGLPEGVRKHGMGNMKDDDAYLILILRPPSFFVHILRTSSPLRTLRTNPHTSSLASANQSPASAINNSCQYRSTTPFFRRIIHLPPRLFSSSSHTGRIPSLKTW